MRDTYLCVQFVHCLLGAACEVRRDADDHWFLSAVGFDEVDFVALPMVLGRQLATRRRARAGNVFREVQSRCKGSLFDSDSRASVRAALYLPGLDVGGGARSTQPAQRWICFSWVPDVGAPNVTVRGFVDVQGHSPAPFRDIPVVLRRDAGERPGWF
jgi:hypothetical protein